MSLAHAILVCVAEAPMTGYELAKRFDSSVGFFWHATHQQIYRELKVLRAKGWVTGKTIKQSIRPNKTVFSITPTGNAELMTWSRIQSDPAGLKEHLMLKFYALEHVDVAALRHELTARIATHQERLTLYEHILARHYAKPPTRMSLAARGKLIGLRGGLAFERMSIAWCRDALKLLGLVSGRTR